VGRCREDDAADSIATSVPAADGEATSERAKLGESLTPSPTIATISPRAWSSATVRSLSSGRTSANTSSTPSSRPTVSATERASPVIITTPLHTECVKLVDGLACLGADLVLEGERTDDRVVADEVQDRGAARRPLLDSLGEVCGDVQLSLAQQCGSADCVGFASMSASTPRPVIDRNPVALRGWPELRAAPTMARASGCSLSDSTAPASASTSVPSIPLPATPATMWLPLVSVPSCRKERS
jgi:hypothetical protein